MTNDYWRLDGLDGFLFLTDRISLGIISWIYFGFRVVEVVDGFS